MMVVTGNICIYIFDSTQDRQEGLQLFNEQSVTEQEGFPIKYEKGNVLIVYWSFTEENARFDPEIKTALDKL